MTDNFSNLFDRAFEIIDQVKSEFSEAELNEVRAINPDFGDSVEFENLDELVENLRDVCKLGGYEMPEELREGIDYEYTWKTRAKDALCDGDALAHLGITDEDEEAVGLAYTLI